MEKITFYTYRNFLPWKLSFILLFIFLSLICLSCRNNFDFESEAIDFYLPSWPPEEQADSEIISYPELYGWQISIRSYEYSEDYFLPAEIQKISLKVSRNEAACICAGPVTLLSDGGKCQFFKMAGGIYPFFAEGKTDSDSFSVRLNWESGFTSYIMKSLADSAAENNLSREALKVFFKEFNWKKMNEKIIANISASGEKFYNPWQFDREALLENLSQGLFDSDLLNTKYIFSFSEEGLENCGIAVTFEGDFLSSFIPQNQIIRKSCKIVLKKKTCESFLISNLYSLNLTASSAKNVSASLTYMPILIDEYEYP